VVVADTDKGVEADSSGDPDDGNPPRVPHRVTHHTLLRWGARGPACGLDAVVVPTARPAYNTVCAMEVVAELGAELVVLCSGSAHPEEVARYAQDVPGLRATVIDFRGYKSRYLDWFATSDMLDAVPLYLGDLSLKRNVGLLLGIQTGWRSLLFLDDDIRGVRTKLVLRAAAGLRDCDAVGIIAREFTDNSIVCLANRLGGGRQGVFVSGSALVVNPAADLGFFPVVYNEDWFFLYDLLRQGRVGAAGCVIQKPYDPFADTRRAADEEYGDVLAEGLMSLLQAGRADAAATVDFWREFLEERRVFIASAAARVRASGAAVPDGALVLRSLELAEATRARIRPEDLVDFLARWRADLARWRELTARLRGAVPLAGALAELELAERVVSASTGDASVLDQGGLADLLVASAQVEPGLAAQPSPGIRGSVSVM
jgi:hypothetical protein